MSEALPTIYLARHCKTARNLEGRIQGSVDMPLCAAGRAEAVSMLPHLKSCRLDRIVSSPYRRARQTAQVFADNLEIPLETHNGLRELHHGDWEGQPFDKLMQESGNGFRQWLQDASGIDIPGGSETVLEAQTRVVQAVRETAQTYRQDNILIVLHKHIRALLNCHLNGCPPAAFSAFIDDGVAPEPITALQLQRILSAPKNHPPVSGGIVTPKEITGGRLS